MQAWLITIGAVIQLISMVLKNKFEKDADDRKRKDDLHAQLAQAIKSGNRDAINDLLTQLRT